MGRAGLRTGAPNNNPERRYPPMLGFHCAVPECGGHDRDDEALTHTLHQLYADIHHIRTNQETIMASFADLTPAVQAVADAVAANTVAVARIDTDFAALVAALPPAGTLTAEQQATLDAAVTSLGASIGTLTSTTASVDSTDPVPAPPVV